MSALQKHNAVNNLPDNLKLQGIRDMNEGVWDEFNEAARKDDWILYSTLEHHI